MENKLKDSVPPHNIEAEKATLGAMLLDWDSVSSVIMMLHASDFYTQQNQVVFEGLTSLSYQGVRGDTLTLLGELTRSGKLEQAGGAAYISSLTNVVPTSANIEYYAQIVKDLSTRRSLIKISSEVKADAFDESLDSRLILDSAEKKIFALSDMDQSSPIHTMLDIVPRSLESIQLHYANNQSFTGIPSGFAKLDSMTSGFQNSEFIVVGARPSMGKTALALNMMEHIALEMKIPCGFFSLEMSYEQIGQRILSQVGHVPGTKLRDGTMKLDELQKLQVAAARCYDAPLYIIDTPNMQLIELRAMARRLKQKNDVKIIFIDYIGLISTENAQSAVYEQVSEISKSLKSLARELNIPIVALCQVSRDAEGNEPTLAQLRGSGSIEQDADVVMFIHRERKKQEDGEMQAVQDAKLIVAKQRNGPIGDVPLLFLSAFTRFENKTMDGERAPAATKSNAPVQFSQDDSPFDNAQPAPTV
jgi:replicative DNA helicase